MSLRAGAAEVDITPADRQFLFGYPHVERYSTGVHDPLLASALVLFDGNCYAVFVANDIIFVDKAIVAAARARIEAITGIPAASVCISATHTHSGPLTVDHVSNSGDPVVPKADPAYRKLLEDAIVSSVKEAYTNLVPARVGFATADATGVGTNRRDPTGPADLEVPVLHVVTQNGDSIACMLGCSMHPTVLHEDSALVSADFPGMARAYIKRHAIGETTPVIYHTGPAGNQSPRHVTRDNSFAEAERLGEILGSSVVASIDGIEYRDDVSLAVRSAEVTLPVKSFPTVSEATARLGSAASRLRELKRNDADRQTVRTAEVDWFGSEETLTLAKAAASGLIEEAAHRSLPAEVMVVSIGDRRYVALPGELFIEYSLAIRSSCPDTFVISLANGELQGYIVTPEAATEGGYEASNALFSHTSGDLLVKTALELLGCR